MRRYLLTLLFLSATLGATAQWKPRPDAFPPKSETLDAKAITMATIVAIAAEVKCGVVAPVGVVE